MDSTDTQKFIITLRYHFGNQQVKSIQKVEGTEEQNRL